MTNQRDHFIDAECASKAQTQISTFSIYKNQQLSLDELNLKVNNGIVKYYFSIHTRSLAYCEEYYLSSKGEACRLFKLKGKQKKILKIFNPRKIELQWEKEFNFPLDVMMKPLK